MTEPQGSWPPPHRHPQSYGQPPYSPPTPGELAPYQQGYYPSMPPRVAPKNPALHLLASFWIPGLGSMMNGEAGKGVGILVGWLVGFLLAFILIGLPIMLGFWIWGMVDAHQGARAWNTRHGIIS